MSKTHRYLYRLIIQGSLLCAAGMATLAGQNIASQPPQGSGAPALKPSEGSVAPANAGGPKGQFVGDVACRNCHKHDKIWDSFYKNPHFKSTASGKEPPDRTGCEACHGAGKNHVDAGGDIDTVVNAFSVMKPDQIIAVCTNCHGKEFNRANIDRSDHTQHNVACTACHSIA